jgi:hypothetical protein
MCRRGRSIAMRLIASSLLVTTLLPTGHSAALRPNRDLLHRWLDGATVLEHPEDDLDVQ